MNVKTKKFAKALVAFVLALAMVSEAWGGLSFVSEAETAPADAVAFPTLAEVQSGTYEFTEDSYTITTLDQLNALGLATSNRAEADANSTAYAYTRNTFEGKTIYLGGNIDCKNKSLSYAIGNRYVTVATDTNRIYNGFMGTFNGCGYTISNITLTGGGMFRNVNNGTIKNFTLENVTVPNPFSGAGVVVGITRGNSVTISGITVRSATMSTLSGSTDVTKRAPYKGIILGQQAGTVVIIDGCVVEDCIISNAGAPMAYTGGIAGYIYNSNSKITNCKVSGLNITGTYAQDGAKTASGIAPDSVVYSENIGGVAGWIRHGVTVSGVEVTDVTIEMDTVFNYVGGFAGKVGESESSATGTWAPTFTDCSVNNVSIKGNAMITDQAENTDATMKGYYHNIGGFAGCVTNVNANSKFERCTVTAATIETKTRHQFAGGLIGSTLWYDNYWTYPTVEQAASRNQTGKVTVKQCEVKDLNIKTTEKRNCIGVGGLVGYLTNGSTISDCGVTSIVTPINTNSQHIGGLVGYVMADGTTATKTTIQNCYVGAADIKGFHFVGEVIGNVAASNKSGLSNLWYCKDHCVVERGERQNETPSVFSDDAIHSAEHASFESGEVAYYLNTGADGQAESTGMWSNGEGHPVIADADEGILPTVMVIFVKNAKLLAYYTNEEGKISPAPKPDNGCKWIDFTEDTVFDKNTWIYEREIHTSITKYEEDIANGRDELDYYISNKAELKAFQTLSTKYSFEGKYIHLAKSIDWKEDGNGTENWGGIGTSSKPFCGTFDGHGETISNLYSTSYGLFAYIGSTANPATIEDFTLIGAKISGGLGIVVNRFAGIHADGADYNNSIENVHIVDSTGTFNQSNCGALVGCYNESGAITISRCTVTNTNLVCSLSGTTEVKNWGFILGRDNSNGQSRIYGCTVSGDSTMTFASCPVLQTGGILGYTNSATPIEDCTLSGCKIECSYAKGTYDDTYSADATNIGGIVGYYGTGAAPLSDCTVTGMTIQTNGVINGVGLAVGRVNGGKIKDITIKSSNILLDYNTTTVSQRIGGIAGQIGQTAETTTTVSGCQVNGVQITSNGAINMVGGMIGYINNNLAIVTLKDCTAQNGTITSNKSSTSVLVQSVGGAVGRSNGSLTATNVNVEGVQITAASHMRFVGGFVGCLSNTTTSSLFEKCKVTKYGTVSPSIKQTSTDATAKSTRQIAGFVGVAKTDTTLEGCTVEGMSISLVPAAYYVGGILGANYEESDTTAHDLGINRCAVIDLTYTATGDSRNIGGVAGAVMEGTSINNCYVSNFTANVKTASGGAKIAGGIVGRIYYTANSAIYTTIKNCYVQNSTFKTTADNNNLVVGHSGSNRNFVNNNFYNCVSEQTSDVAVVNGTTITDANIIKGTTDAFEGGTLAYSLNTTAGTEAHNGSWAQGTSNPILADENNYPVAYVTYLNMLNNQFTYWKFPLKNNGEIDYTQGTKTVIAETSKASSSCVYQSGENTYPLPTNVIQEDHTTTTFTNSTAGEPAPNAGRIWQKPEGKILADTYITQVEKTAWDYNGDTKLNVADLVRSKRAESANYSTGITKACTIGNLLTQTGYDMSTSLGSYSENETLATEANGYLSAERLRRVILTPPSTEVSVLSYNLYYTGNTNIDNDTRRNAIAQFLQLDKNGTAESQEEGIADFIALQEVEVNYWHDVIYTNYLAPEEDANGNPISYAKYKHVGVGRYGSAFYTEDENSTEESRERHANDSFNLILYNSKKYEYKDGDNGTIYLSDTPSVPSRGWKSSRVAKELWDSERAVNWAIFTNRDTLEQVMFVNVHLSNSTDTVDRTVTRMAQIELVLRKLKQVLGNSNREIPSGGMPVIIAGDFNAYAKVDAYSYTLMNQYQDVRAEAPETEMYGAFNNWTRTDPSTFTLGDHIMASQNCEALTYDVMYEDSHGLKVPGTDGTTQYYASDHCPVKATLDVGTDYIRSTTSALNDITYFEWDTN